MRILLSVDMEGVSGVVSSRETGYPRQVIGDPQITPDYLNGQRWLTADINAAVEGAMEAGATSFVVHDTHGLDYRNVLMEELNPAVEMVKGLPVIFYEYEDLDNSYDAAFLIGMHARAGEPGVISHVLDWPLIREVRINGQPVGESEITIALSSYYGIPTVLITGDDLICDEVHTWTHNQIETAVVKKSLTRYAAHCLSLPVARERIRQAAKRAVERIGEIEPRTFASPITLEVDFSEPQIARYMAWMPGGVTYNGRYTASFTGDDFLKVYQVLLAMLHIASSRLCP